MARTALAVTDLVANGRIAQPAGVAGTADGHFITGVQPEELVLRVVIATAETDLTIDGGTNPPALEAVQGNAVYALAVGTHLIGPFSSGRFQQSDGIHVNYETAANVTITALRVPRNA